MNSPQSLLGIRRAVPILLCLALLASCGSSNIGLSDPQLKVYLLDLTGSGSTSDQLRRIYDEIELDVTKDNLGQPYGSVDQIKSPVVSEIFFVGTNSRYLLNFTLQDFESIKSLYQFNTDENNSSNAERVWGQISHSINLILEDNIQNGTGNLSQRSCETILDRDLSGLFSDSKRKPYVEKTCEIIAYSSKQYFDFINYVNIQSKLQSHSDVFGAISAINDKASQFLSKYPKGSVRIIMATDGDHNIQFDQYKNLKEAINTQADICTFGKSVGSKAEFKSLKDPRVDMSDKPGVGALGADSSVTAEYANKLSQFWNCFPA